MLSKSLQNRQTDRQTENWVVILHTQHEKEKKRKNKEKKKSAILQNAEGSENKSQERKRKIKKKKTEDPQRISSSELLLQIFVLDKGLRKPQFKEAYKSLQRWRNIEQQQRRMRACNGLEEEETQEESSAASQRAMANQVVGTYHLVGDCSPAG